MTKQALITKTRGWRGRLASSIQERRRKPFEWGVNDCGLFAADCVLAMTGVDLAEKLRGKYRTEEGAAKALRRIGLGSHVQLAEENFREIPPMEATLGDIAIIEKDSLGIVNGETVAVYSKKGIGFVPMSRILRAFRVEGF
jgi:hypothetical protein